MRKRMFCLLMACAMLAGNTASVVPAVMVHAHQEPAMAEEDKSEWYVLGRPMTEEEEQEQLDIISYYEDILKEIPCSEQMYYLEESQALSEMEEMRFSQKKVQVSESLPIMYSSKDLGYMPAVRSQGSWGNCWAHSITALMEISMIKQGLANSSINLSEGHLIHTTYRPVADPLGGTEGDYAAFDKMTMQDAFNVGGSVEDPLGHLMAGMGPREESGEYTNEYIVAHYNEFVENEGMHTQEHAYGGRVGRVTSTVMAPYGKSDEVKKAIMKYGAVAGHYNTKGSYNANFAAQYSPTSISPNHAVTFVGWDDTFPKSNFSVMPPDDGAWLVRNSWGADWGDEGYFWLSYYDQTITGFVALEVSDEKKYDNLYQYDKADASPSYIHNGDGNSIEGVNIFTIQKPKESLKAVQFGMQFSEQKYEVQVYKKEKDGSDWVQQLDKPIKGYESLDGRYTVELGKTIEVKEGDQIAVSLTVSADDPNKSPSIQMEEYGLAKKGQSYYKDKDGNWKELENETESNPYIGNLAIRILTKTVEDGTKEHDHEWGEEWQSNSIAHWKECTICYEADSTAYEEHLGGEATCSKKAHCEKCNHEYGETVSDNHEAGVRQGYIAATTSQKGHTGALYCSGCNALLDAGKDIDMKTEETLENLEINFKKLDDSIVSSTAQGKVKLILFYDINDKDSITTLKSAASKKLEDAEIVAVEISGASKESIENVQRNLGEGKDTISFCYDLTEGARDSKRQYEEYFFQTNGFSLPIMAYVNSEDKLVHMVSGSQTIDEIRLNLAEYCAVKGGGFNMPNPVTRTYTTLQGEEITTTAEDKIKILVYFWAKPAGGDYAAVFNAIEELKLENVDIYAISILNQEEDTIKFANNYISAESGIKVAHDTEWGIPDHSTYGGGSNFLTTILIDADNQFQSRLSGKFTSEELLTELKLACGYTTDQGTDAVGTELVGYSLSLEGNIGVNFYLQLSDEVIADAKNGAYMSFILNGSEQKVYVRDAESAMVEDKECYVFKCSVPVKDMNTEIGAQLVLSDGSIEFQHSYTVEKYADYIRENKEDYSEKTMKLVEAMSDFGAYASAYFTEKNVDEIPQEMLAVTAETLKDYQASLPVDEYGIYYGSSLLLKSETILRHYFTEEVEGAVKKGNLYYIESTGILAHKLGENITITVTTKGDMEITYSPLSYAYEVLSREGMDENLTSLMRAMYLYYQAAQDYQSMNK